MGGARGVEVRASSIRLKFTLDGTRHLHTLKLNGQPMLPTPANIRYAERLAADIRERIRLGTFKLSDLDPEAPEQLTLSAAINTWLGSQRLATSTRKAYESAARFWARIDGPVDKLKLGTIQTHLGSIQSGKTVNNYVSVLRKSLQLAVEDGHIRSNIADKVPRAAWQKSQPDPFNEAEVALLSEHPMVAFWLATGLRSGEIYGLRWTDITSNQMTIASSIVAGERKGTKTNVARTVLLNSRALAALERVERFGELVFHHAGKPWADREFRRHIWNRLLKTHGIRYRRPYAMRHTFASMMLTAGLTPAWCARQMGHSVDIFLGTYAKWLGGDHDQLELSRLEAAWGQSGDNAGEHRGGMSTVIRMESKAWGT